MSVLKLWPGAVVVCIGCGPSLAPADVEQVRRARELGEGHIRVIAINAAVRLAPWADARYAHHADDWCRPEDRELLGEFRGLRYCAEDRGAIYGAEVLAMSGATGLELENRGAVRHGKNSGYQAINVAVHLGARRIVLLGYDLQREPATRALHFYACGRPLDDTPDFKRWGALFATLVAPLAEIDVDVFNASRATTLTTFPRIALEDALAAAIGEAWLAKATRAPGAPCAPALRGDWR